jgi:hypothetical protein
MRVGLGLAAAALAAGVAAVSLPATGAEPDARAAGATARGGAPAGGSASSAVMQEKGYPFTEYDGRFTFVRVFFDAVRPDYSSGGSRRGRGGGRDCSRGYNPCWYHDYPDAEQNLTALVNEITFARTHVGGNVIRASDPELHRHPLAWLAEPGYWVPDAKEVENLRSYLLKGGFIIFDDFGDDEVPQVQHLLGQMQRIVPELRPILLDGSEPIFHSFFDIAPDSLLLHGYRARSLDEQYIGYFEDNDPRQRQLAILNANNDIGEFIEYRETGFSPVDMTNQAYMLAVNYIVYALTH